MQRKFHISHSFLKLVNYALYLLAKALTNFDTHYLSRLIAERSGLTIYVWAFTYVCIRIQTYILNNNILSWVKCKLCYVNALLTTLTLCVWYIALFVSVACRLVSFLCLFWAYRPCKFLYRWPTKTWLISIN